jgi:hypothetical protein
MWWIDSVNPRRTARREVPASGFMANGKASGDFIVFADGFAGAIKEPGRAAFRPSGLA